MGPVGSHRGHVEKDGALSAEAQGYDTCGEQLQETGRGVCDCAASRMGLRECLRGLGRGAGAETCAGAEETRSWQSGDGGLGRRRGCMDQKDSSPRRSGNGVLAAAWEWSSPWRTVREKLSEERREEVRCGEVRLGGEVGGG